MKRFNAIDTPVYATMLAYDIGLPDPSNVSYTFH